MQNPRERWNQFGRFITGAVIAMFFLPFFGVSCQGMEVISISGTDMVGGCQPGGMLTEMAASPGTEMKMTGTVPTIEAEPTAIVALGLAVVGFGLAWVRTRPALVGSFIAAVLGLAALAGLFAKVGGKIDEQVAQQSQAGPSGMGGPELASGDLGVDAGARMGFWLTALGFLSVAGLTGLSLRDRGSRAVQPPQPSGQSKID
jgi:hypothetical protein